MGQPIEITNQDYSAADLRRLASREKRGEVVRRLLALAMILEGHSRTEAAAMNGMDRQTLRDWVHRYNAEGLGGLISRVGLGPVPLLSEAQMAELLALVVNGPDPAVDKVVRWRCVDLQEQVARRFSVETTQRTIGRWLRQLKLTRLQPRPFHPKKDLAAQEEFKKRMARPVCKRFFQDEPPSLLQRIRPRSKPPAKMEIRASRSS
jgi:transposase